jgi:hypothetical protein
MLDLEIPKVFVRHPKGGSAGFIITLLRSFSNNTTSLTNAYIGHRNRAYIEAMQEHNFQTQWGDNILYSEDFSLDDKISHIRKKYSFHETKYPYFICHTHVPNPDPLMLAFKNTKLINITFNESDLDQLCYNSVTKVLLPHDAESKKSFSNFVDKVKQMVPTLLKHDDNVSTLSADINRLVSIAKTFRQQETDAYLKHQFNIPYPRIDIEFSSIQSKSIVNQLDQLAEFIGVELSNERKLNAVKLVDQYASKQGIH